jgi:hypothetical protein
MATIIGSPFGPIDVDEAKPAGVFVTQETLAEALRQFFCGPDELPHHDSTDELAEDLIEHLQEG